MPQVLKTLTAEEFERCVEAFTAEKLSVVTIAKREGVPIKALTRALNAAGLRQPGCRGAGLSDATVSEIVVRYGAGESSCSISASLGLNHGTVRRYAKKTLGHTRTRDQARIKYRRREDAFDPPLSDAALYWTGMLITDGSIDSEGKRPGHQRRVRFSLHRDDEEVLVAFKDFVGYTGPITYSKRDPDQGVIEICSDRLVEAVKKLGVVERKSTVMHAVEEVRWSRDFWRGVWDGNGYIAVFGKPENVARGGGSPVGTLSSGSGQFVEDFADYCKKLNAHARVVHVNRTTHRAELTGENARRVLFELYHFPCYAMPRKMKLADHAIRQLIFR